MGHEVRFSFVLNDLSMTIPDKVWLHYGDHHPGRGRHLTADRGLGQHGYRHPHRGRVRLRLPGR